MNRNHSGETKCEGLLRKALTRAGIPFEQEAEISGYHVDFLIRGRICVEVDGYSHISALVRGRDEAKTKRLVDLGYTVMRVPDSTVANPHSLRVFMASLKAQLDSEAKAASPEPFESKPFASPELAALRDRLSVKETKARGDDESELFRKAVDRLGPGPRGAGGPKRRG